MNRLMLSICLVVVGFGLALNVQADEYSPENLQVFAQKKEVVAAMKAFKATFGAFRQQNGLTDLKDLRSSVHSYYQNDFSKAYAKKNDKPAPNLESTFTPLDDDSIALQYYYISANSHPLGKKDLNHQYNNTYYCVCWHLCF